MVKGFNPKDRLQFQGEFYFRVKGKDILNVRQLYTLAHEWFVEEEWAEDEDKFPEHFMWEKRNGKSKEYLIYWNFNYKDASDPFAQRSCMVEWRILGVKDIEIQHNGTKIQTQKGTVEIKTWWFQEYDSEKIWRKHWLLKHLLDFYVNRMFKKEFEAKRGALFRQAKSFQSALKEYFNIFSFDSAKPDMERVHNLK